MSDEKPTFQKDIPARVCWLAQDADGTWWGYEIEPHQQHHGWSLSPLTAMDGGNAIGLSGTILAPGLRDTCTSMCNGMRMSSAAATKSKRYNLIQNGKIPQQSLVMTLS